MIVNPNQINSDQDSHGDACDNCPSLDNENQADFDQDNIGDECCQKNYKIQPIGQVLSCCNDVDGTDQWRRYEIEIHVYDRFEAIQKYCSRFLRKDDNLRSNCFINMLLQIPKANFHRGCVERKVVKYYETLLATPLDVANQAHEIEIIPYEDLWEFILESLDTKFHKVK